MKQSSFPLDLLDTTDAVGQSEIIDACFYSPIYFIHNFVKIYDSVTNIWIPFGLWPAQAATLRVMHRNHRVVLLKARQLGMSWLSLGYALWEMLFNPSATVLVFSRRETEAIYLLGEDRLKGMYKRLPRYLQVENVNRDSSREWGLSNGSVARAFTTNSGDSYAGTLAIVDEADLVPDLDKLMRSVQPTIADSGKIFLVSRVDKNTPDSPFKNIYKGAKAHKNGWAGVFLPWYARPDRTKAWYESQKRDSLSRTSAEDALWEQYPATDKQALAPPTLDRRFNYMVVDECYWEMDELPHTAVKVYLNDLTVYDNPIPSVRYVIGADPAEGNPNSDDSVAVVVNRTTGEEVALLRGKYEPTAFANKLETLSLAYNFSPLLVERNNHGHSVIAWLNENTNVELLRGIDRKLGWHTNAKSKNLMYDALADDFIDKSVLIHSNFVYSQVLSLEGSSLSAPAGMHDDASVAFALANVARQLAVKGRTTPSIRSYSI